MSNEGEKHVVVLGGGPGGYVAAIHAASLGACVTVIEKNSLGGTCVNKGCIPTKALVCSANMFHDIKNAGLFGINVSDCNFDFSAINKRKQKLVQQLSSGVSYLMQKNKINVEKGTATLIDNKEIEVRDNDKTQTLTADKIIIATGSEVSPMAVEGYNGKNVINSDDALELETLPESIVIIGGGVIGAEFAQIFKRLEVSVTVIEMMPHLLATQDEDVSLSLEKAFKKDGIQIFTNARVNKISDSKSGLKITNFSIDEKTYKVESEKVLVAAGRHPVIENIGLEKLGIETERGCIVVNDFMETNIPNVYAIGDVIGGIMLAHKAMADGTIAAKNAMGVKTKRNYRAIPSCVWTSPEVASVGLTEKQAREIYGSIKVSVFPFSANGKSRIIEEKQGFVKAIADPKYGELLGVHIIGPHATELIAEASLALQMENTVEDLIETIHPHPTLSEGIFEAGSGLGGTMIHF